MDIKQLLRNYRRLVLEELKRIPKKNSGDIEFWNEQLVKIDQALQEKGE